MAEQSADKIIDDHELKKLAERAFDNGGKAMRNAGFDEQTKLFGLFTVDAGLAAYATMVYNVVSDYAASRLAPRAYDITHRLTENHLSPAHAQKTAALATFGVNVALKSGGYLNSIIPTLRKHHQERIELARKIAPALDDLKGKHSLSALSSVGIEDNEMIYAHRRRLSRIHNTQNINNFIDLVGNSGANLLLNVRQLHGMLAEHKHPRQIESEHRARQSQEQDNGIMGVGRLLLNSSSGVATDRVKKSNEHNLKKSLQPYSALEMVLTLEEQVQHNPKARSFQVPGRRGESYALEEYIMRIAIQHQKDMADLSPNHTEIREALREELAAAVKPVAEAIRRGDIGVQTLIHYIGGRCLVQKGGRVIADPEEMQTLIERDSGKHTNQVRIEPKEYYKELPRGELKATLQALEGEEKAVFASWIPDSVLEDLGMKKDEIQQMRAHTVKDYTRHLAEAVVGLAANDNKSLRHDGVASADIKRVGKGAEAILEQGETAINALRATPSQPTGIENMLVGVALNKLPGERRYISTLLDSGRQAMRASADGQKAQDALTQDQDGQHEARHDKAHRGFRARLHEQESTHAARH